MGTIRKADEINENRLATWKKYYEAIKAIRNKGIIKLPTIPKECIHNAHMFYLKTKIWKQDKNI